MIKDTSSENIYCFSWNSIVQYFDVQYYEEMLETM